MKIIFLNIWQSELKDPLQNFISHHAQSTDLFCLQEVDQKSQDLCSKILPTFTSIGAYKYHSEEEYFEIATYYPNHLPNPNSDIMLANDKDLGLGINTHLNGIDVCNFHGNSLPGPKQDDPNRLLQSQKIIEYYQNKTNPVIIGGDFNLEHNTQSVSLFEKSGYINLIKEYNIKTTRNHYVWDRYPNKLYYSDYVFVSPNVTVKSFTVSNDEVSDHLPLIIEI